MKTFRRVNILFIVATIVIPAVRCQTGIPPPVNDGSLSRFKPSTIGRRREPSITEMSRVRTKGLCRDGWTQGTMRDVSGLDIPICLKINAHAQSWEEAKSTCRKDYGFLMKLDSIASWEDNELLSVLYKEGIKKTWTGVHTEHGRLVWDDLIPSQLKPHESQTNSDRSLRPWRWDSSTVPRRSNYCGYVDINDDSNDRRKRSSDDDHTDGIRTFDLSSIQEALSDSNYRPARPVFNYPRTAAFQSELTRTQMSDDLPGLPSSSLGLQSALQIPGSGLSESNTQDGGLSATKPPTFDSVTQKDKEENKDATADFGVVENTNTDVDNPPESSNSGNEEAQAAIDKLREHFNEMQNIQSDTSNVDSRPTIENKNGDKIEDSDSLKNIPTLEFPNNVESSVKLDEPSTVVVEVQPDVPSDIIPDSPPDTIETMSDVIDSAVSKLDSSKDLIKEQTDIQNLDLNDPFLPDTPKENTETKTDAIDEAISRLDSMNGPINDQNGILDIGADETLSPEALSPDKVEKNKDIIDTVLSRFDSTNEKIQDLPDILKMGFNEKAVKTNTEPEIVDTVKDVLDEKKVSIDDTMQPLSTEFGGSRDAFEMVDPPPSNDDKTLSEAMDTVKDILAGTHVINDDSDTTLAPPVTGPTVSSITSGLHFGIVPKTEDNDRNDIIDHFGNIDDVSTDDNKQIAVGVDVPSLPPPLVSDNNKNDVSKDEMKDVDDNDILDSLMDTVHERNEITTQAWAENTKSHDDIETDKTKAWDHMKPKDGVDDDIFDDKVTIKTTTDGFEQFTEMPFARDDKSEINDILEDIIPSTLPPINIARVTTDDRIDDDADKMGETEDDFSEKLNDYLSQFSNHSETTNLHEDDDKHDLISDKSSSEKDIDDVKDIYENFIENVMSQSNDSTDDDVDKKVDETQWNNDNEEADSLIESIRETQNSILGISDDDHNDDILQNDTDEYDFGDKDKIDLLDLADTDIPNDLNDEDETKADEIYEKPDTDDKAIEHVETDGTEKDEVQNEWRLDDVNEDFHDRTDNDHEEIGSDSLTRSDLPEIEHDDVNENRNHFDDIIDSRPEHEERDDNEGDSDFIEGRTERPEYEDRHDDTEHVLNELDNGEEDQIDQIDDKLEDLSEIKEEMRNPANLGEMVTQENTRVSLQLPHHEADMVIGSCEARLPSVCFSYEVEVMAKASTCDYGWYGHVLLDTCFKLTNQKMTYRQAVSACESLGSRLVIGDSEFQRQFVLIAVQKDGQLHRGEKFWKESPVQQANTCRYFSEREANVETSCNAAHRVVCIKDAKTLSIHDDLGDDLGDDFDTFGDEDKVEFSSRQPTNTLLCDLPNTASEFPVLWFKDGVLVKTMDKYVTNDVSLRLDDNLIDVISHVASRNITKPVLQGKYWCEVWDRKSLTRKRSTGYDVRFKDVISFHGSMELRGFSRKQEVLFNMVNERFESLARTELDIQRVFMDVLPRLQRYMPEVQSVYTYADNVRLNPSVIEYHTYFTMSRDYTTEDEELLYGRLKALLRSQLGNVRYMTGLEGGTPIQSFRTMSLQSTVSCPATSLQTTRDLFGKTIPPTSFSFPKVLLGEFANSINNCSERSRLPAGTARCLGDFHTGAYWSEVVANECADESNIDDVNEEIWGTSPFSQKLVQMSETPVNKKNVEEVVQEMTHITDAAVKFTPSDINKIADILDHSTQIPNLPKKVGENVLKTVNKLLKMDERETHMANLETKAANRILKSVDRFANNLDLDKKDNMRLVSDNVVVEIWDLKPGSRPVIGLAAETVVKNSPDEAFKAEHIATVFNSSQLYDIDVDAAIELPREVFTQQEKGERLGSRLTMVVYRKSRLFNAALRREGYMGDPTDTHFENLNSFIISASIAGKKIAGLNDKVRTIFKPLKESDNSRKCVWWDFMENNFKGGWSTVGCRYDGKMNGRDVCLCDHLTNFAVLLDFYGQSKPIEDHHELSLSIITMIGLSLSILGLSLTIISYIFFRKLRQGRAQQTLFNLSLALLFSMMVFLIGIKQTHNHYICLVVAVLLHYFILVSFMWMLMEAMLQYLTFVKILGTYIERFTMKTVLPAWGLPVIPVVAVLSVDYNLYKGGPDYCWMSLPAFYYAFTIPISLIILINVIIFFITVISIFRRGKGLRSNQKKQKIAMTNLQAAFTSFILLGLTWIFGYLAISDARITFQYIFTILNSLQGFFIFILFVVRKKKVRDQWYIICCRGSEKGRVSRSLSASNSIPSSCSSGSRNSRTKGGERDRSDSTKTVQSTYSNSSIGYTNYGYETGFDQPFNRHDKRFFRQF